jgi:hypothetical protein
MGVIIERVRARRRRVIEREAKRLSDNMQRLMLRLPLLDADGNVIPSRRREPGLLTQFIRRLCR